jgi:hypothetical protein
MVSLELEVSVPADHSNLYFVQPKKRYSHHIFLKFKWTDSSFMLSYLAYFWMGLELVTNRSPTKKYVYLYKSYDHIETL